MTEQQTRGSRAVFFGVHAFSHFPELKGVSRNIPALRAQVTDPEVGVLPEANCVVLPAHSERGHVLDAVCQAAEEADDLLLVYYAGHGHYDRDGSLLLATEASSHTRRHHSVPYEAIREYVETSRARRKVVIVDCCYSGLALRMGQAPTPVSCSLFWLEHHTDGTAAGFSSGGAEAVLRPLLARADLSEDELRQARAFLPGEEPSDSLERPGSPADACV
ncbi:caspase, EACC1-associated type [Streptomyces aurantiogriseus]|uniref:Peptidase C14 caspase domain-containing protein n=1 Tax=Streptomyces aurantiogriseus TaxID=66870 RepID=A0A918CG64_9ACTN|nr:caspase family protein [Streptomyces aurantiogriseus]GGR22076.1 hypothetical protein GCM10010251_42740 [Streptomyces aurantiogriseus]